MNEERRKWPRILTEHLVAYTRLDEEAVPDEAGVARTLDLSRGGLVLEMIHPLEVGSCLELKMVTGDRILKAEGQVVYSEDMRDDRWRVGVCFTEIADEDLAIIAREVEERRADNG
jgi:hypothetical protein